MSTTVVTAEQAGRGCPYCHATMAAGEAAHECPVCGSLHHEDCWQEGDGCAIFGCPGRLEQVEDDIEVEIRTDPTNSGKGRPRRRLIAAGIVLILLLGFGMFLLLKGNDDERESAAATPQSNGSAGVPKKARSAKNQKRKLRRTQRMTLEALAPAWTNDPGGNWSAYVPSSASWSALIDEGNQSDAYQPRYLTTAVGPKGSFVAIHTTPNVDPRENEANYTIDGKRVSDLRVPAQNMATADLIVYKDGPDECRGKFCATALMSDGQGGGIAFVAGFRSRIQALTTVKRFASTVDPHFR